MIRRSAILQRFPSIPVAFTTLVPLLIAACCLVRCTAPDSNTYAEWHGETMGTYYTIKARTSETRMQPGIDSLLAAFNKVFSTYDTASVLSHFNRSLEPTFCLDGDFDVRYLMEVTDKVYRQTGGYFDPTVLPLVRYWGFADIREPRSRVDSSEIDSLKKAVGWSKLKIDQQKNLTCLERSVSGVQLDFSAIAKGYGVDLVASHLEQHGIEDYMVEIGGEISASGISARGEAWNIGIDKPVIDNNLDRRTNQAVITLDDRSVASSGNYRNFYRLNDRIVGHTINPVTGYPEVNDLLSVSVVAETCIYADALATGFMALGFERAYSAADSLAGVSVLFMRLEEGGEGFRLDYTGNMEEIVLFASQ